MQLFVLRPTFDFTLLESHETAVQKITAAYQGSSDKDLLRVFGEYGEIHLPSSEHRIWSPHLSFSLDQRDGKTVVHGRFAPRFEIWTFVWMGLYGICNGGIFRIHACLRPVHDRQQSVGPLAWLCRVAAMGLLIAVAHIGQQFSADQMHQLRGTLDEFLKVPDCKSTSSKSSDAKGQWIATLVDK